MNNNRNNYRNSNWQNTNSNRNSRYEQGSSPQNRQEPQPWNDRYNSRENYRPDEKYYRNNFEPDRNNFSSDMRNNQGRYSNENYGSGAQNYSQNNRYGASLNYGSMGSYGGAQGFGSARNGYNNDGWGSGHRGAAFQPEHRVYGAYRDHNSFAEGEKESYDGTQRYGSQGADNSRGWARTEKLNQNRNQDFRNRNRYTRSEDDSRYEIYDTALSQYNRGDYNNSTHGSVSQNFNQRSHQNFATPHNYGSLERGHNRQGSGSDQDVHLGTDDINYGNTAGSLDGGNPDYRDADLHKGHYFDPTRNSWNRY